MVSCIREFVDANAQTARASQHFIVEDVVFVILGANIWEKFCEHRHELSQVCRQILQVCLDSHVADPVRWLVVEMQFDFANHANV